ncbi:MAG: hypothetical protein M3376_02115 [Actinomycetota bacterium]|nr:hypothetical protein [Actinomycetota bacterium]
MRRTALLMGIAGALLVPGVAQAAAPDGAGPWADRVAGTSQGTQKEGDPVRPERSDPTDALGVAERTNSNNTTTAYSLGFKTTTAGGYIDLGYDNSVCNGSGADLELVEDTAEPYTPELVDVYVSRDDVTYTKVADNVNKDAFVSFPASVGCVSYVRLVDQTNRATSPPDSDGYDVDGVRAIHTAPAGRFSCSANALRVGLLSVDLANANEQSRPCADDSETVASTPPFVEGLVSADVLNAETDANPGGQQGGTARSSAADVGITPLGLNASLVESNATVSCNAQGQPRLSGSSRIVGLSGPGPDGVVTQSISIPLLVGTLHLNYQRVSNGRLIQRAIYFQPNALGSAIGEIVVAESEADYYQGNPCR